MKHLFLSFLVSIISIKCVGSSESHGEKICIESLSTYITIDPAALAQMHKQASESKEPKKKKIIHQIKRPFFKKFPTLKKKIPLVELADLPTPIIKAEKLTAHLKSAPIYIKQDDVSGKMLKDGTRLFGGNKMRILEIEMGRAVHEEAQTVITMGCDGSNLVTAVAACADYLGLSMVGVIKPQPNAHVVQRNLLLMDHYGARFVCSTSPQNRADNTIKTFKAIKKDTGNFLYFIPMALQLPIALSDLSTQHLN